MSKQIDFSKPLSEEDEAYAADRPWLLRDAELSGYDVRGDNDFRVENADEGQDPDGFEDHDEDEESEDEESDESEDEGEGDEDEVAPYTEWEFAALQTEAKRRELNAKGSKEQLIERLEQDDASAQE